MSTPPPPPSGSQPDDRTGHDAGAVPPPGPVPPSGTVPPGYGAGGYGADGYGPPPGYGPPTGGPGYGPSGQPPYGRPPYGSQQYGSQQHGAGGPAPATPRGTGGEAFFSAIRGWGVVRTQDRWAGGVAGGLALRLGVDPLITRGLLAASVLLGGFGLVLYGIAWALLPEQRDGRIHLQELFQGRFTAGFLGSVVVLLMGLSSLPDRWLPGWWGPEGSGSWWFGFLWLAAAAVVVALLVQNRSGSSGDPRTTAYPTGGTSAPPPAPGPVPPAGDSQRGPVPAPATAYASAPSGASAPPYTSAPVHGPFPGYTPQPAAAYAAPGAAYRTSLPVQTPVRPRPHGPGAPAVGVVTALTLLTLAGLLVAERSGLWDGPVLLTAGAVGVVLAGLGIVVSGLRGRTSGALGWIAVLGILVLLPVTLAQQASWDWYGTNVAVGDIDQTPMTVEEAERGYSIGAGEIRVDLTQLDLEARRGPVEVPVSAGAGDVTVVVPEGSAVVADITLNAGRIQFLDDLSVGTQIGVAESERYESAAVEAGEDPVLQLEITVGAGDVTVREER